jgi:hypothetical protein
MCRALRGALCYLVALQALLAAYGTAIAASKAGDTAAGFVICHGNETTPDPANGTVPNVPCALCGMVTSAGGLPLAAIATLAAPLTVSHRLRPLDNAAIVPLLARRAGLARAPPQFA